jgi:hypothetical protein
MGMHQVEVFIRLNPKVFDHLIEHLPVLSGEADDRVEIRMASAFSDDRGHLDGLWPRPED